MNTTRLLRPLSFFLGASIFSFCAFPAATCAAADLVAAPPAIQPGGNPVDNTLTFGTWWNNASGSATEVFDTTHASSNNISGSILVDMSMLGDTGDGSSANLSIGDWFSTNGSGGWLGSPSVTPFDISAYASLDFDLLVNNAVSSNSDIPVNLFGAAYDNISLGSVPVSAVGWNHYSFPITGSDNMADCVAWGFYNWYNTTASTPEAYDEFWVDNVRLVAKTVVVPPPTLSIAPVSQTGLFIDSGPGDGGNFAGISTAQSVGWFGAAPVAYAMTVGSVPNPVVYSNYEAYMFIAPGTGDNTDWNPTDEGWLFITNSADGTATARLMWKTNDPNDNTMYYNGQFGGVGGTNNHFGTGTLGTVTASSLAGTWTLTFNSDTNITVTGPGGASGSFVLPPAYLASFENAGGDQAYVYFGASPNGNANSGQAATLSKVSVTGGPDPTSFDFSTTAYDTTQWTLNGNEVSIIPSGPSLALTWTLPAANFSLWDTTDLGTPWQPVSGNTNLAVTVTPYNWGTNHTRALIRAGDIPSGSHVFYELRKLAVANLQILMPGETNAPNTLSGKVGTALAQPAGNYFNVTINAVDSKFNVVSSSKDTLALTSSDPAAAIANPTVTLANGSASFEMAFGTTGPQTITATDTTATNVPAATSAQVTVQ